MSRGATAGAGNEGQRFAVALRRWRLRAGLSQEDLATLAGLSLSTVSGLERGKRRAPQAASARLLADALQLAGDERAAFFAMIEDERVPPGPRRARTAVLPAADTPLYGREAEVAALQRRLDEGERWITIIGEGGIGKTRLALEVAHREHARRRVIWLAADSLSAPEQVLPSLTLAAGLAERPGLSPASLLAADLRDAPALVVLDNMEHLLDASEDLAAVLAESPGSSLLATSRERFRVRAETVMRVDPLPVPASDQPGEIAANPGVRIFLGLDPTVSPYQKTARDLPAVARIVRTLDGIPLAIELAAARAALLSPLAIADLLDVVGLPALDARRDGVPRQRSMERAIRWSLDLLPADARMLLGLLSVFRGGFTVAAAVEVAEAAGHPRAAASLPQLQQASLVREETIPGGSSRFRMLEPIRLAASAELAAAGADRQARDAHAAVFRNEAIAAAADQMSPGGREAEAIAWFGRERANLLAALDHLLAAGHSPDALALANALGFWWEQVGAIREGREHLRRVIARDDGTAPARDRWLARWLAALLALEVGEYPETRQRAEEVLAIAQQAGDAAGAAMGELMLAIWQQTADHDLAGALDRLGRAIGIAEEAFARNAKDWLPLGYGLSLRGAYRFFGMSDAEGALPDFRRGIEMFRRHGSRTYVGMPLVNMAGALQAAGRRDEALAAVREALAVAERFDSPLVRGNGAMRLASLLSEEPDREAAAASARLLGALEGMFEQQGFQADEMMGAETAATRSRLAPVLGSALADEIAKGRRLVEEEGTAPDLLALAGGG